MVGDKKSRKIETNRGDLFHKDAAWATKAEWPLWHFYYNSVTPICGLGPNLLSDGEDVMVAKHHLDFGACDKCIINGQRAGLWHT